MDDRESYIKNYKLSLYKKFRKCLYIIHNQFKLSISTYNFSYYFYALFSI